MKEIIVVQAIRIVEQKMLKRFQIGESTRKLIYNKIRSKFVLALEGVKELIEAQARFPIEDKQWDIK